MRNALFFDIDGTLLSDVTGKIPDSALDALKKTIELGNLTFINTGRCYCSVPMELKRAPFSGYLCGCGTYIMLGDEVMCKLPLRLDKISAIRPQTSFVHSDDQRSV